MNTNKTELPGCEGEHLLQEKYATQKRAHKFYEKKVFDYITPTMEAFIGKQTMLFLSSADAKGECDSSFRAGDAGFVMVLNEKRLIYPEFGGNGVMASLGNISENGHVGLLFIDFFESQSGLHINGKATILDTPVLSQTLTPSECEKVQKSASSLSKKEVTWVLIEVEEAYIHCSKYIPALAYN